MTLDRAVEWMAEHGHSNYQNAIRNLQSCIDETIGDAGRYWQHCEFTQTRIAKINKEIDEIKQHAYDRYEDWATD